MSERPASETVKSTGDEKKPRFSDGLSLDRPAWHQQAASEVDAADVAGLKRIEQQLETLLPAQSASSSGSAAITGGHATFVKEDNSCVLRSSCDCLCTCEDCEKQVCDRCLVHRGCNQYCKECLE